MMKKRWVALIALVSLATGAAGASWFWFDFYAQLMAHFMLTSNSQTVETDLVTRIEILEKIRAGRIPEATRYLEVLVDGDLMGAAALTRDGTEFGANLVKAVELEAQARAVSGYAPENADVRRSVEEALRLLRTASKETVVQSGVVKSQAAAGSGR